MSDPEISGRLGSINIRMQQQSPACSDQTSVSMKSKKSIDVFPDFKDAQLLYERGQQERRSEAPVEQTDLQLQTDLDSIFLLLEKNIICFVKNELKAALKIVRPNSSDCLKNPRQDEELMQAEDDEQTIWNREAFLKITTFFLKKMNQEKLADHLQNRYLAPMCKRKLKSVLKKRFQCLFEGIAKAGSPTLLDQIYTELYVTEGGTGGVNDEHEVTQVENACRKAHRPETKIRHKDMFKLNLGRDQPVRTVMTMGVAGIGKTVLTQKFTLDWAEGRTNQNIQFLFPFTFRELNVLKERKFSLVELVHHFFTETKGICSFDHFQVLFIFDGLDESRLPLDFSTKETLTDVTESTSVDVLLTNLIRGNLLPSALLWITTRPAAANQIPPQCVDMVTEVRGFTDPQKEEYFRRRFRDEEQASRIISHIKTSKTIHIMCHIPVFSWITATVLEDALETREGAELPNTLTEMYIHFLVVQTKVKTVKYDGGAETESPWSPKSRKMMESLGKLAFDQLQKGNLIFYESDLTECGIDIREASVYSGVFTQIFKEERGLYQNKFFCFVHLSIQEFLAALHVHLTFINSGINLMSKMRRRSLRATFLRDKPNLVLFYQDAVDKAIEDANGQLDLVLRFLLGLSLPTNQTFLGDVMATKGSSSQTNQEIIGYIKKKINGILSAEKTINLFHCLNELKDRSLVEEIQQTLSSESLPSVKLSPAQLSALAFILLSSAEDLDVFDLKRYSVSEEDLSRLLPVVQASTKAILSGCDLSERSCEALSSVLCSGNSALREMDLSTNNLQASVTLICAGLQNPNCLMEAIRLSQCNLSVESCRTLSSVLCCKSTFLRRLDLSNNDLWNSGVKVLCDGLKSPECLLETLSLSGCLIASEGCISLSSALSSNPFHLRELDLTYNHPGKSGERSLSAGLKNPLWKLQTLRMDHEGPHRLKPGLRKYACKMELDPNTAHRQLQLSDNRKTATQVTQKLSYPDHKDRFSLCTQVLCRNVLCGRCYWEVEWRGKVEISVAHGEPVLDCVFGATSQSWSLECCDSGYAVWHNNKKRAISSCFTAYRIAVYVDCDAGILSFYRVWCHNLNHLYTFRTRFSAPVYPGFRVQTGSVSLY